MKHPLKTALALVATLALLLVHGGFVSAQSPAPAKKMGCCGDACPTHCCVERGNSAPAEPLPAVPVTSSSQQFQAALLPEMLACFRGELIAPPVSAHCPRLAPASASVPLYVRTHSFLI